MLSLEIKDNIWKFKFNTVKIVQYEHWAPVEAQMKSRWYGISSHTFLNMFLEGGGGGGEFRTRISERVTPDVLKNVCYELSYTSILFVFLQGFNPGSRSPRY